LKIFADKKMKKSWYSKNLDIYQIPSIKKYSLEAKIKNKKNNPSTKENPSSILTTSPFPQKMSPSLPTDLTRQLKNQSKTVVVKHTRKVTRRTRRN